ncbi:hypothetical protein P168DRAFT_287642 [Aspergillus campestris IBT 28561]|uniref:Uncharacterized protein n=1 Tax=Aspergillus campestris (strain IBT 28561) TaxID=1392248 RepID=A0A2I1DB98_ASPC2|nr:uncharacterized protein P168DRAFT_287642 [Aspergillus campestris IBT 28561]PKY07143.1 hypothetical protein P168DRAFT_287642 [Aspergillus campestris IBT 28561]
MTSTPSSLSLSHTHSLPTGNTLSNRTPSSPPSSLTHSLSQSGQSPGQDTPPFFAFFHDFTFNPRGVLIDEFNRLACLRSWSNKGPVRRWMWNFLLRCEFKRLVLRAQDGETGAGPVLADWQGLCVEVGVGGEEGSIRRCKKALAKVHINLVDLLEHRRLGTPLKHFPDLGALIRYTRQTGKFVSRELVKGDPMVKVLLRKMR